MGRIEGCREDKGRGRIEGSREDKGRGDKIGI